MDNAVEHQTVLDTDQLYLGDVYAKSLLGAGGKAGKLDEVLEELNSFTNDLILTMPKLRLTLESPRIAFEDKEKILNKILTGGVSKEFANFVKVLTRNGRFDCLPAVKDAANKMFNETAGRVEAVLTTAETIDDSVKQKIAAKLEAVLGKKVDLKSNVDPEILGGMLVRVGDTVFDGSIANQLDQVRARALESSNQHIRQTLDRFATAD